jgi:hypothetical protein
VKRLHEALAAAGRDPSRLRVRGDLGVALGDDRRPDLARTLARAPGLAAAGATDVQLPMLAFVRRPEGLADFFAELEERWAQVKGEAP